MNIFIFCLSVFVYTWCMFYLFSGYGNKLGLKKEDIGYITFSEAIVQVILAIVVGAIITAAIVASAMIVISFFGVVFALM